MNTQIFLCEVLDDINDDNGNLLYVCVYISIYMPGLVLNT